MDPVTVSVVVSRPRDEVFEYLADIANHAEFTDHYLVDWHLLREETYGVGAGARFRVRRPRPFRRFAWADATLAELDRPRRIVEHGRAGKFNRVRTLGIYDLDPAPGGDATEVSFTFETQPKTLSDRLAEGLGARSWIRRKNAKAMRRLRAILEDGQERGVRATVAGGPRKPATGSPLR